MIFNSLTFVVFLLTVVTLYWVLGRGPRLVMLLLASMIFYGFWRWEFLPLLFVSILVDYFAARFIGASPDKVHRKVAMITSLALNLGLLGFFKYFYFFADSVNGITGAAIGQEFIPYLNILLPVGISFYTFQSMSYTIDVYRGFTKPQRDFLLFANYVIFFPQLVAGPILRANEVLWQLDKRAKFELGDIASGLQRIVGGLFLKVVLADNIASFVDDGFATDPANLSPIDITTLAFLFGFQIYFDFAGYSHIAIGAARMMGIGFPENFRFPYLATSPREFWKRWHITLSSWIRDYLYLPLAGATVHDRSTGGIVPQQDQAKQSRLTFALFATWAIMGLWHGAAWAFVFWGVWHAVLIYGQRIAEPLGRLVPSRIAPLLGWAISLPLLMLSWIPFRAQDLGLALELLGRLFALNQLGLGLAASTYAVAAGLLLAVAAAPKVYSVWMIDTETKPGTLRAIANFVLTAAALFFVIVYMRNVSQFIYFQF